MSTIEEAREQAREALATLDQELLEWLLGERSWCDQHHGKPDEIELTARADAATIQLLTVRQAALRALLDATEPPKPAEDEREALTTLISATTYQAAWGECVRAADAILAAGYSKGPRPITDEMVEAAAREYHERGNGEGSFARMSGHVRTSLLFRMKCAFNAAEAVGS